jgi:uncharacterized damage-inducible protein DinB
LSKEIVDAYAGGADKLSMAVRGLSAEDLAAKPQADAGVGKWSIQYLLAHLADCDGVFADRMKRMIAEDNPQLLAFSETHWAANLAYEHRSGEDSLALFKAIRQQMTTILRHIPAAAWQRTGVHSEAGKMSLSQIMEKANSHLDHHLEFIHAKRRLMGKEMW